MKIYSKWQRPCEGALVNSRVENIVFCDIKIDYCVLELRTINKMGRLMDDVLAMFGVKPSDRVNMFSNANVDSQNSIPTQTQSPSIGSDPEESEPLVDCLECKLIGTVTLGSCSIACLALTNQYYRQYKSIKRVLVIAQGAALASFFLTLAISRALNKGIFALENVQKSPVTIIKDEIEGFKSVMLHSDGGKVKEKNNN